MCECLSVGVRGCGCACVVCQCTNAYVFVCGCVLHCQSALSSQSPLSSSCSITATSGLLDVVLNSVLLLQLKDFFVRKDQFGLPLDWTEQVRRRLRELRARTAAELRMCVYMCVCMCVLVTAVCPIQSSRAKLNINVDITAPQFIRPQW